MLSKDVAIVNGMVRTKDSVKMRDSKTKDSELSDLREELSEAKIRLRDWKNEGRETGDVEYEIKQLEKEIQDLISKGMKDSKTKDGEDQTIGNYNGYHIVFNGGFIRAQEDGFTKIEFPSSMGAGGWSRADVQKMFDKIDARRSGMKDSKTKDAGNCSNYRSDTESCRTGCKRIRVNPGEACPFDLETERGRWPGDFQADCPCYK